MIFEFGIYAYSSTFIKSKPRISYNAEIAAYLGNDIHSSILLQRAMYWSAKTDNLFYKFVKPCNNPYYVPGTSWTEELAFSDTQVHNALKKLSEPYNPQSGKEIPDAFLLTHRRFTYLTFFVVNWGKIALMISEISGHGFINSDPDLYTQNLQAINPKTGFMEKVEKTLKMYSNPLPVENQNNSVSDSPILYNNIYNRSSSNQLNDNVSPTPEIPHDNREALEFLSGYMIPNQKAQHIASKFSLTFIKTKMQQIESYYKQGKIKNLQSYIITAFENSSESVSEFEMNCELERKQKSEARLREIRTEEEKQAEDRSKEEAFLACTDNLIASLPEDLLEQYTLDSIQNNRFLYQRYKKNGRNDMYVDAALRNYLMKRAE